MNFENYQKTKEELEKEIKNNQEKMNEYDEKSRMAQVNKFEYKIGLILGISALSYFFLFILPTLLTSNSLISSLVLILPGEGVSGIIIGASLIVGTMGLKVIQKINKLKKRFTSFSNARTETEKLEEQVTYSIELEKAYNKKCAIKETIDSLMINQMISLSTKNEKKISQPHKETKNTVLALSKLLREKQEELDVLVTKQTLHEMFWKINRSKADKFFDILASAGIASLLSIFIFMAPMISELVTYQSVLTSVLAPFIVSAVITSGYMIKRNRNYTKAFHNLNKKLGKNALSNNKKTVYEEEKGLSKSISAKIKEVSIILLELQEQKRILESFTNGKSAHTLEKSLEKVQTIETEKQQLNSEIVVQEETEMSTEGEEKPKQKVYSIFQKKTFNSDNK